MIKWYIHSGISAGLNKAILSYIGNNRNDPAGHCVKSAQILYTLTYGESKKADLIQVEIRVMATGGWGGCSSKYKDERNKLRSTAQQGDYNQQHITYFTKTKGVHLKCLTIKQ